MMEQLLTFIGWIAAWLLGCLLAHQVLIVVDRRPPSDLRWPIGLTIAVGIVLQINSTPSSSIGPPFGGYRLDGVFRLSSVGGDPTVSGNRLKEFSSDVGSQQTAVQISGGGGAGNLYGGVYHGGLVTTAVSGTDLATSRYVPEFAYTALGTVTWPDGSTAYFTDTITIRSDGRLRKSVRMVSAATFLRIYLDMVICSGAYQRARHDAETAWYNIPNNAETDMLPGNIVWSRCREDGRTI